MPLTLNGVGTRYFGKKNEQQRPGVCRSCGRTVNLRSYDTRLWFVVLFVPIIPLARKHIMDFCPSCRRHYVMAQDKWDMARQLETSGAMEKFRTDPTPENAVAAHQQLLAFHQIAEAADLQKTMQEKFPDNARVFLYLAGALNHLGRGDQAAAFFQRAWELRPDLPEARVGLAEGQIRAGLLDPARSLLDFLEKPGASQLYSLGPLERLALAYQKIGRHAEALDLFGKMIVDLPALPDNPRFRNYVKVSEKALNRKPSILPKSKFSFRRLFTPHVKLAGKTTSGKELLLIFGILFGLALVFVLTVGFFAGREVTVYVVNGSPVLLKGEISGVGRVIMPRGVSEVKMAMGHHVAKIDPPFADEISFDIHVPFFIRLFDKTAWILNPGAEALILRQNIVYGDKTRPSTFTCEFGNRFVAIPNVEYPFSIAPKSVTLPAGTTQVIKTALILYKGPVSDAFGSLVGLNRQDEAWRLAEWRLAKAPDDEVMPEAYEKNALSGGQSERAGRFLRGGLAQHPIRIEWHRTYQNLFLHQHPNHLIEEYDKMLAHDPTNSAMLYLRGRICASTDESIAYFRRSLQSDASNPYPSFAIAYQDANTADWSAAQPLIDKAISIRPNNTEFFGLWTVVHFAVQDPAPVEEACRRALSDGSANYKAELDLCQALILQDKTKELHAAVSDFRRAAEKIYGKNAQSAGDALDYDIHYLQGNFAEAEKISRQETSSGARKHLAYALIEQGRIAEAEKVLVGDSSLKDTYVLLCISLGWRLAGDAEKAGEYQKLAAAAVQSSTVPNLRSLLAGNSEISVPTIMALTLPPKQKSILLAALSFSMHGHQGELAAAARKQNVDRTFPYYLVQRATETH